MQSGLFYLIELKTYKNRVKSLSAGKDDKKKMDTNLISEFVANYDFMRLPNNLELKQNNLFLCSSVFQRCLTIYTSYIKDSTQYETYNKKH